ncbi:hypothetical protein PHYSODRAFT_252345 [Phytophthora sojae]|uniref:Uncharacterized protein n=1 Tax=Phytophthora sojae (strain P6497) TaxID=1094619 RepID=G5A6R3_PHYSP|nr:hypothetical protein PHYSODRAFT_252345 [Phytophthora sojae]EGZ09018.1 hypothetical protein PHYSODRAFT_252345 [Phytophthora sojae]|eukprot:XP_009535651.1 hypothetical protein PHYSODRAFT_252345 [Phytophthora sojae]
MNQISSGKTLLIDDLKKVVRQHLKIASLIAADASSEGRDELFIQPTDELLYAMDIQDINTLYAQTDLVFSDCGLDLSTETKDLQRLVTADGGGVAVLFARKQHMMYSFEQTSQSMWRISNHIHRQFEREEFAFEDPETTHAHRGLQHVRVAHGLQHERCAVVGQGGRFVAGEQFYNHEMYGSLRKGYMIFGCIFNAVAVFRIAGVSASLGADSTSNSMVILALVLVALASYSQRDRGAIPASYLIFRRFMFIFTSVLLFLALVTGSEPYPSIRDLQYEKLGSGICFEVADEHVKKA